MGDAVSKEKVNRQPLTLPQELLLMLLNEETGFFHQIPGWSLNCALVGAALAELSLDGYIDTDMKSLVIVNSGETGDADLDSILKEIAKEPKQKNAQYWIEKLAGHADSLIDSGLENLVKLEILRYHQGDFWTLEEPGLRTSEYEDIKTRIGRCIFSEEIPSPRDTIIIALVNTCDVFRFIFELDENGEAEKRIQVLCKMDLIARSIALAVEEHLSSPLTQHTYLKKKIPRVPITSVLFNKNLRSGNIPALFGSIAEKYGPVFTLGASSSNKDRTIYLVGRETNQWAHRRGRYFLRTKDYLADFEKVYNAAGLIPALDGADHFRLRKTMQVGWSRKRLENQLDSVFANFRKHVTDWKVDSPMLVVESLRYLVNEQLSPVIMSINSQDLLEKTIKFKERALTTHVVKALPKFLLHTPAMKRCAHAIETATQRVKDSHTHAQRVDAPRDLADDLLSLHASDPQFLPESNMKFLFSAPMLAAVYLADTLGFGVYAMISQPEIYRQITAEADELFANGDPGPEDLKKTKIEFTHRFIMECDRMYPIIPLSFRNVMNSCVVEGYELPVGVRVGVVHTGAHYMSKYFPDPYTFDMDRYLPDRSEHNTPAYSPFGWGTHTCLGIRWMELHMAVNLLMLAHYFDMELAPTDTPLKINAFPSLSISKKMKFRVKSVRRELPVQTA